MRKLISIVHISLDGFVAGPNGELDKFPEGDENLAFVCRLTEDADAALFGRKSYELLNGYWPSAHTIPTATQAEKAYSLWYNKSQKFILSRTLSEINDHNSIIVKNDLQHKIQEIKNQQGKNILIFGSPTVTHELMKLDLVDGFWIFINPVLFGEGIPLFRSLSNQSKLKLISTHQFKNGEIALNYHIDK